MKVKCDGCGKEFTWPNLWKPPEADANADPARDVRPGAFSSYARLVGCVFVAAGVAGIAAAVAWRVFAWVAGVGN